MLRIMRQDRDLVHMEATGQVDERDYEQLVPLLEAQFAREGRLRALVLLRGFRGWTLRGLREELRFDLRHRKSFDRVAVVGERKLEEWGTKLAAPFFSGQVRWFDRGQETAARRWISEGRPELAEPHSPEPGAQPQAG